MRPDSTVGVVIVAVISVVVLACLVWGQRNDWRGK